MWSSHSYLKPPEAFLILSKFKPLTWSTNPEMHFWSIPISMLYLAHSQPYTLQPPLSTFRHTHLLSDSLPALSSVSLFPCDALISLHPLAHAILLCASDLPANVTSFVFLTLFSLSVLSWTHILSDFS